MVTMRRQTALTVPAQRRTAALLLAVLLSLGWSLPAYAEGLDLFGLLARKKGVKPVTNALYLEECGACHFAFQPGWLPSRSWKALMAPKALSDHFGDDAELEEPDRLAVEAVLLQDAAERSSFKRSRKINRAIKPSETPSRISDTRYIKRKHAQIPERLIGKNDKVGSLANCDACHTQASSGSFDDDQVNIPNHGIWTTWLPFKDK